MRGRVGEEKKLWFIDIHCYHSQLFFLDRTELVYDEMRGSKDGEEMMK